MCYITVSQPLNSASGLVKSSTKSVFKFLLLLLSIVVLNKGQCTKGSHRLNYLFYALGTISPGFSFHIFRVKLIKAMLSHQ